MIWQGTIGTSGKPLVVFDDSIRDDVSRGSTHCCGQQTIIQTDRGAIPIQTHAGSQSLDAAKKSCALRRSMVLINVVQQALAARQRVGGDDAAQIRVYFSGLTFLVLAEITLERGGYPPS